jgi:predicted dehydrogenase
LPIAIFFTRKVRVSTPSVPPLPLDTPPPDPQAAEYNCRLYTSPEEAVADPAVDAVYVLTNMESHHQLALQALAAGKPVYIEKPVATTLGQLADIQHASQQHGVAVMPGHNYVYDPGVRRIKEMIECGDIGDVRVGACSTHW